MGAGRKIVFVILFFIMIFAIIGIINSYNNMKEAEEGLKLAGQDVQAACFNLKVALDNLKDSIDGMTVEGIDTTPMLMDYNMRVAEYNQNC